MKNIQIVFSKVLKAVVAVMVFGLFLGLSAAPLKAEAVMVSGSIIATPDTIDAGQSTQLKWNSFDATSVSITPNVGSVSPSGSISVSPSQTTTYTLHLSNSSGATGEGTATVYVRSVGNETCQDHSATNYGGSLPCHYNNNNGEGPDVTTRSATNIDRDEATLRGEVDGNGLPTHVWFQWSRSKSEVQDCNSDHDCEETDEQSTGSGTDSFDEDIDGLRADTTYYFRAAARNSAGTDYGSILSFHTDDDNNNNDDTCRNTSAINYGGSLPCRYVTNSNYPTVNLYADSTSIAYNAATFLRWTTSNATSCYASGGSTGWTGVKSIGPASFYTGSLTSSRTYTLTCSNNAGSATDSVTVNVRGRTTVVTTTTRPAPTSLVLITSSIDRNQPIQPTLDNTRPHVGDEINYTVTYQNIGTAAITNLTLRLDLPREVDYMFSNPNNPMISGSTLIFTLGSLPANGQGTVTVRVRVREDAAPGALLNFPAVLSYTDPAGYPQSVSANVSAQVWSNGNLLPEDNRTVIPLGASVFGAGFWPTSLFGWLLFLILILVLVMLVRSLFTGTTPVLLPRKTVTTTVEQH
jgi:uncharacterized repeat protein (TIGR01451 family)